MTRAIAARRYDAVLAVVAPEAAQVALAAAVPFPKRLGKPEEYAATALFLIGHDYINAEHVRMDGGIRMGPK